ncbi:ATP-binding protein [Streptomyces corynorhini]|uniref:ATP-binding protein n=1 Tax=Streptomyces corynorhini TaxID=2282652 RepID=A0A370AY14_9ACTN|nr:ATP-binding protein [Streptomyces corynorhini]RDG34231.1 ATP-binding protein [Streptomyces corynorhini]
MGEPNEVAFRLTRRHRSVPRARATLHAVLGDWALSQTTRDEAELVLSELVTNALRVRVPGDRQVGVRIVRVPEEPLIRLEVSDAGAGRPEIQHPGEEETGGRGLMLVEALSHRWGVKERACGIGKTVWAELKAQAVVPEPTPPAEVPAAMVLPGHSVRVWGRWLTALGVRGDLDADGVLHVVIDLNDGPALRVHSREPLIVRKAGAPVLPRATETAPG